MITYRISHCFRSEFLTGHSLKVIGCIAFIHNLNSEHCLNLESALIFSCPQKFSGQ